MKGDIELVSGLFEKKIILDFNLFKMVYVYSMSEKHSF